MDRLIEQTMEQNNFLANTINEFKNVAKVKDYGFIYDITKEGEYSIDVNGVVCYKFEEPQNDKRYVILKTSFHTVDVVEYKDEMNKVSIENAKRIFKNVDVVQSQTGSLVSILGKGNYVYEHCHKEVRFVYPNGKYVVLLATKYQAKIIDYKKEIVEYKDDLNTPNYYDNTNGSLYKVAQERGWNTYLFDIVKRLERAEKKGEFKQDLEKSINVIKLWQNEN